MMTRTKLLIVGAILALLTGLVLNSPWVHLKTTAPLYVLLPLGAILLGLGFLSRTFESESKAYDHDQEVATKNAKAHGD